MPKHYYDFFAGGGMVSFGLGREWKCVFANEIDEKKASSYRSNHYGGSELLVQDIATVSESQLPESPDLVWASFPCQDLSLAGNRAGLDGKRSGTFRPFWKLMEQLSRRKSPAKIVAVENVYGTISSNGGKDFNELAAAFSELGYRFGAFVVDAAHFVPQSRPRFFIVGVHHSLDIPKNMIGGAPNSLWHPNALIKAQAALKATLANDWVWWNLTAPHARNTTLADLIETSPKEVKWHTTEQTNRLLNMMTETNLNKVLAAKQSGQLRVGTIYKRTRTEADGQKRQRAEVRFDGIAGCLRTPAGGSSRQTLIVVEPENVRTRLISPREACRLMGLPDSYELPNRYNDAYKLAGDGVAVPVVKFLRESIFDPLLKEIGLAQAA